MAFQVEQKRPKRLNDKICTLIGIDVNLSRVQGGYFDQQQRIIFEKKGITVGLVNNRH